MLLGVALILGIFILLRCVVVGFLGLGCAVHCELFLFFYVRWRFAVGKNKMCLQFALAYLLLIFGVMLICVTIYLEDYGS